MLWKFAADCNNRSNSYYTMYTLILNSQAIIMLFSFLAEQCLNVLLACVAGAGLSRDGTIAKTKQWDSKRNVVQESEVASRRHSLCSLWVKCRIVWRA